MFEVRLLFTIYFRLAAKLPSDYKWYKTLQRILVGKVVSVTVSKIKLELYPNITAHGLTLTENLHPANIIDLVKTECSLLSESHLPALTSDIIGTSDDELAVEQNLVLATKHTGISSADTLSNSQNSWHESLLQEFEETFKCESTDDNTLHGTRRPKASNTPGSGPGLHSSVNKESPAVNHGQTVMRKRLLSQLDTSLSSPVGLPRSRPRIFSPCHHPATSTPRQPSKKGSLNRSFINIMSPDGTPIKAVKKLDTSIKETDSHSRNISLDLFSEMTESLTLLSFNETSKA